MKTSHLTNVQQRKSLALKIFPFFQIKCLCLNCNILHKTTKIEHSLRNKNNMALYRCMPNQKQTILTNYRTLPCNMSKVTKQKVNILRYLMC